MLTCQIEFRFLSVPDLQPETFGQDAMDYESFSRSASSNSAKSTGQDQDFDSLATCSHDTLDHGFVSRLGQLDDTPMGDHARDAHVPVNCISPEAYALLAAAEALAAHNAEAVDAEIMDHDFNRLSLTNEDAMGGMYEPVRSMSSMPPPKKYFRAFWQSISLRLLYKWTQAAKPSK